MKRWKDSGGAAMVELAIVLPLFLVLLFGLVEFGLILYYQGLIAHASREGARRGAAFSMPKQTDSEVRSWVQNYLTGLGISNPFSVMVSGTGGASGTPLTVKVDLTYRYAILPTLMGSLTPSLTLTAETSMQLE
jgi:Flp pilus assembly protein TadG